MGEGKTRTWWPSQSMMGAARLDVRAGAAAAAAAATRAPPPAPAPAPARARARARAPMSPRPLPVCGPDSPREGRGRRARVLHTGGKLPGPGLHAMGPGRLGTSLSPLLPLFLPLFQRGRGPPPLGSTSFPLPRTSGPEEHEGTSGRGGRKEGVRGTS